MKTKKISLFIALVMWGVVLGCSSKNDPPVVSGKSAKITITLSGTFSKAEGDYFDVTVTGNTNAGTTIDWMVNGTRKTGTAVRVGTDDFNGGKTIVLESASNFFAGQVNLGGFEFGNTPFAVTYKVEVNGAVKDQGTENIAKDRAPVFSKSIQL